MIPPIINPYLKQLWPVSVEMLQVVVDNHLSPASPVSELYKRSRQPGTERALSIGSATDRWGRGAEPKRCRIRTAAAPVRRPPQSACSEHNTENSASMRNLTLRQPVRKDSFTSRKATIKTSSPTRCIKRSSSMDDMLFFVGYHSTSGRSILMPSEKNLSLRQPQRQSSRSSVFRKEGEMSP